MKKGVMWTLSGSLMTKHTTAVWIIYTVSSYCTLRDCSHLTCSYAYQHKMLKKNIRHKTIVQNIHLAQKIIKKQRSGTQIHALCAQATSPSNVLAMFILQMKSDVFCRSNCPILINSRAVLAPYKVM